MFWTLQERRGVREQWDGGDYEMKGVVEGWKRRLSTRAGIGRAPAFVKPQHEPRL